MNEQAASINRKTFPDSFSTGVTVLIATAGEPSQAAVDIQALCAFGNPSDRALVVTTTESVTETLETFDHVCVDSERPALSFVETTSTQPSVPAIYDETPIILTPSPGDLERIVVALAELSEDTLPVTGNRHLVVRSLTPMLESTSTSQVCTVLERITGLRSGNGLCLFGLDYTAHDESTLETIVEQVDGVLWVTQEDSDSIQLEYRPTRGSKRQMIHERDQQQ
jgi:hypothetical protein